MAFPKIGNKLFHNNRVYIWIAFCNLYGLYWLLFRHNYIFNGMGYSSPFDPLIGYRPFRTELVVYKFNLIIIVLHIFSLLTM